LVRRPHWGWWPKEEIRFQSDAQYEDHFLSLFRQAVRRRTGPGAPILAHLSGGMDSTSIVCMSDHIRVQDGASREELIDTVSYYDDSETNWDERPYFEAVERNRGKRGVHLRLPLLSEDLESAPVGYLWPGADMATYENEKRLIELTGQKGYRVILAGFGGDELLGGVPDPLPELADFLARGRMLAYLKRAVAWCLTDRTPLVQMTGRVFRFLLRQYLPPQLHTGRYRFGAHRNWRVASGVNCASRPSVESPPSRDRVLWPSPAWDRPCLRPCRIGALNIS
jgi:asparagine synthase (glutamine-hydrolysing)